MWLFLGMVKIGLAQEAEILYKPTLKTMTAVTPITLRKGDNSISIMLYKEYLPISFPVSVSIVTREVPPWMHIENASVSNNSSDSGEIQFSLEVTDSPEVADLFLPFTLKDSKGQHWKARIPLHVSTNSFPTDRFYLGQNTPNPFNPSTIIQYSLPTLEHPVRVKVEVFNSIGQLVKTLVDEDLVGGNHQATWDGSDNAGSKVSSGRYYYRFTAGYFSKTQGMVLLK
jgi:hypothetical protein